VRGEDQPELLLPSLGLRFGNVRQRRNHRAGAAGIDLTRPPRGSSVHSGQSPNIQVVLCSYLCASF
jgi:hypothetical protein